MKCDAKPTYPASVGDSCTNQGYLLLGEKNQFCADANKALEQAIFSSVMDTAMNTPCSGTTDAIKTAPHVTAAVRTAFGYWAHCKNKNTSGKIFTIAETKSCQDAVYQVAYDAINTYFNTDALVLEVKSAINNVECGLSVGATPTAANMASANRKAVTVDTQNYFSYDLL